MGDDWDISFDPLGEREIHVKPEDYTASCVGCERRRIFDRERLVLTFQLMECPEAGARLPMILLLPARQNGVRGGRHVRRDLAPDISTHSKYARAWVIANWGRQPDRTDRMAASIFRDAVFRVRVRDVTLDWQQRPLARAYSVVDTLLRRLE